MPQASSREYGLDQIFFVLSLGLVMLTVCTVHTDVQLRVGHLQIMDYLIFTDSNVLIDY